MAVYSMASLGAAYRLAATASPLETTVFIGFQPLLRSARNPLVRSERPSLLQCAQKHMRPEEAKNDRC
jgi:hypothetical protein